MRLRASDSNASGEFAVLAIDTTSTLDSVGLNMRANAQLLPGAELLASIVPRIAMQQQASGIPQAQ